MKSSRLSILAVTIGLCAAAPSPLAQEKRAITETDLFKFVWIADPQMSPEGSQVAFVRVTVDQKTDQYETSIWLVPTTGGSSPRRITGGIRDNSPRWSPDGSRLAFVRAAEQDGRVQPPQIYVMAMAGGEGRAITTLPRGAANPAWSPDGKSIAFTSQTFPEEAEPKKDDKAEKPRQSDVRVITRAVYRANGVAGWGYVDADRPSHIWTVDVDGGAKPKRITSGEFSSGNHKWSRDGKQIFFTADRRPEPYYLPQDNDLYAVSRDGGEPTRIASIDGNIGAYAQSPDGKRIAFVGAHHGAPERSYSQPDLWVAGVGGTPRNLTEKYDFDIDGGLAGDQRAPRGAHPGGPIWSDDGSGIIVKVGHHGITYLKAFDARTGADRYQGHATPSNVEVMSYTAASTVPKLAMVISSNTSVGDLYVEDGETGGKPARLTSFNDELFNQLTMNEPEEIWYDSFDGKKIQGWILKPPAFDASKKYPLILQIHGGPHAAYGNTFTHEFQWMAAKGYVVLYTNPRGSSNYGQDFGNIIQFAYPGDDYKDLMAGVDEVIKKGYIDVERMGVTGGSGGGLLTNWTVTQTNRFKAAVSQRDISDWANFWYTADFTLFRQTWFRKPPFQDPKDFAARSPITNVEKIQTPLLFILGDEDWRTPPSAGGEDLFRALKFLKRETAMVRFPNENHDLSRSGKPWHRVERLQHIVGWFDKYLLGKKGGIS